MVRDAVESVLTEPAEKVVHGLRAEPLDASEGLRVEVRKVVNCLCRRRSKMRP